MSTRKKFKPEKLKHLRANPYTLRATPDSIFIFIVFQGGVLGPQPLSLHRYGRLPQIAEVHPDGHRGGEYGKLRV